MTTDRPLPQTLPEPVLQAWHTVSEMPFENLTKVIKYYDCGERPDLALRMPEEVLSDHARCGTGATCFALVFLFRHLLRNAGLGADLVTCDRYYGTDTHAAAVVGHRGRRWMFDPGYHIVQPLPDSGSSTFRLPTNPNASRVVRLDGERCECYTGHGNQWRLRFVLKDIPLTDEQYRKAWENSFRVDMMGYPVLNRFEQGRMIYLQKSSLIVRDLTDGAAEQFRSSQVTELIREHYGIPASLSARALKLMGR